MIDIDLDADCVGQTSSSSALGGAQGREAEAVTESFAGDGGKVDGRANLPKRGTVWWVLRKEFIIKLLSYRS